MFSILIFFINENIFFPTSLQDRASSKVCTINVPLAMNSWTIFNYFISSVMQHPNEGKAIRSNSIHEHMTSHANIDFLSPYLRCEPQSIELFIIIQHNFENVDSVNFLELRRLLAGAITICPFTIICNYFYSHKLFSFLSLSFSHSTTGRNQFHVGLVKGKSLLNIYSSSLNLGLLSRIRGP